jgi:hypothetical protein
MKIIAFWDIAPCISWKWTDVSQVCTATIIGAMTYKFKATEIFLDLSIDFGLFIMYIKTMLYIILLVIAYDGL